MVGMRFCFRFAALLKQRRYELRQAQLAFSRAHQDHEESVRLESRTRERMQEWLERWQHQQAEGLLVGSHLQARDYVHCLEQELLFRRTDRLEKSRELERQRLHLLACERKVKMLECLEEREWEDFQCHRAQQDQKQLDEMTVLRKRL